MVSVSAILPASALVLLALASSQVDAHGYMLIPEAEFSGSANSAWIVQIDPQFASDDWDGNTDQSVTTWKTLAAKNSVSDLRTLLDGDTSLYGAECGFTLSDATPKTPPTDGKATFSRGMVHVGPCEIWLDDTKVLSNDNCETAYGTGEQDVKSVFPVDYSSCSSSGCMLRFYWLAFQGLNSKTVWQVYKDCVPLTGGTGSTSTKTTSSVESEADTSSTASSAASSAASPTSSKTSTASSAASSTSSKTSTASSAASSTSSKTSTASSSSSTPTLTTSSPSTTTATPTAASSSTSESNNTWGGWSGGWGTGANGKSFGF